MSTHSFWFRSRQALICCLTMAAVSTTACDHSGNDADHGSGQRDKVTYLTGFGAFGRDAYAWVAEEKGYFKDVNIDVDVRSGAAGDQNLKLLEANQAQFAVIDFTTALIRAGRGRFGDFRLTAAITQQSLIAIMALDDKGIAAPPDLAGKTIAQATGAIPKTLFPAYARRAGFDPSGVRWTETSPQQLPALLAAGRVDAIAQFVVGQPVVQQAAGGRKIVVLPYRPYFSDLYGNALATTTRLLASDPDLVRRFTAALLKGLTYAVDHPDEAGRILHKAIPASSVTAAAAELKLLKTYVRPAGADTSLGQFERSRVARSADLMRSVGEITGRVRPEDVVDFSVLASS